MEVGSRTSTFWQSDLTVDPAWARQRGDSQAFGYDAMNRLLTADGGYGLAAAAQTYAYTTGTNRLLSVTDGSTTVHQFTYSPTGNVTQDNRAGTIFNLGYNQADRLATIQQATTPVASYAYDAFGQHLLKSLPGSPATTVLYQYDLAGHQIEDSDISTGTLSPLFSQQITIETQSGARGIDETRIEHCGRPGESVSRLG